MGLGAVLRVACCTWVHCEGIVTWHETDRVRPAIALHSWLQAMNSNYFLWIIVVVSVLAVLSKLTGAV